MTRLAFCDTETTSLDPETGQIWEVGLILREEPEEREFAWLLPVDLGTADPVSLANILLGKEGDLDFEELALRIAEVRRPGKPGRAKR